METIFDFIKKQETEYDSPKGIELVEGWNWSMKNHLRQSFLYLNSQFVEDNESHDLRPFKNIVLPILNIQYRTEGFDVKDIELYVDNPDEYFKSLLIKKYHDKWALENQIDTFIDEMTESYCTYGGTLVRKTNSVKPEVIDLRSLAFCNQNDILSYPFGILHELSFSQLRKEAKARGWGKEEEGADIEIEELIKKVKKEGKSQIKIYEVHGSMPIEWLENKEIVEESEMDENQIQVVAFYKKEDGQKQGVCLFKKRMPELPFKLIKRDDIKNRALGRGGVEELFDPQIWTNWSEAQLADMRDSASKTVLYSDDPTLKSRNNLDNFQNNEIISLGQGRSIGQVDTYPRKIDVFNDAIDRYWQHAQLLGSAAEALLGEEPSAGTPFKLYEAQQIENKSLHKYRQGKLATFMDEIYRDWILPKLAEDISKEQNFLQELSADEMQIVVDRILVKKSNEFKKRIILGMQDIDQDIVNLYQEQLKQQTAKMGIKQFFKILKDEMKNITLSVYTNIAGKQKNLALMTDKIVNVIRQFIATPQIRQDPEMIKLLNTILESSGLSPITFSASLPALQPQGAGGATTPLKDLSKQGLKEQTNQNKL